MDLVTQRLFMFTCPTQKIFLWSTFIILHFITVCSACCMVDYLVSIETQTLDTGVWSSVVKLTLLPDVITVFQFSWWVIHWLAKEAQGTNLTHLTLTLYPNDSYHESLKAKSYSSGIIWRMWYCWFTDVKLNNCE